MKEITIKQFLFTQPEPSGENSTDNVYLSICNNLLRIWEDSGLMSEVPDELRQVVVIGIVGYYQDILCDTGLWRSFTEQSRRLYNKPVPFHDDTDDYIDFELNRSDIEFVLWYELAFNSMQYRYRYPRDPEMMELAEKFFSYLESKYEEIDNPEGYREFFDLELHDSQYSDKLYTFIHWLYWKNWLILPTFQLTFAQLYPDMIELQRNSSSPSDAEDKIEKFKNQIMASVPTGPLALYLKEWLNLIIERKTPRHKSLKYVSPDGDDSIKEHPYYTAFINANNGSPIRFISTYNELNDFFIKGMKWAEGEEHIPDMKGNSDFVLMATSHGGLMIAKNIAKCIKHPDNKLYDKDHARKFAFNLISQRGVCPGDMLRYICEKGWLPDATFPEYPSLREDMPTEEQRRKLAVEHLDFLSRAYLQEYYRGE